jgi:xylan 1,4-beta-xylosidase
MTDCQFSCTLAASASSPLLHAWQHTRDHEFVKVLIANGALRRHPIRTEVVVLRLRGVERLESAFLERVDDDHAKARRAWLEMGRPENLLPHQVTALLDASALVPTPIGYRVDDDVTVFEVEMPAQGTALLTVQMS